jgi:hypothetical protein
MQAIVMKMLEMVNKATVCMGFPLTDYLIFARCFT